MTGAPALKPGLEGGRMKPRMLDPKPSGGVLASVRGVSARPKVRTCFDVGHLGCRRFELIGDAPGPKLLDVRLCATRIVVCEITPIYRQRALVRLLLLRMFTPERPWGRGSLTKACSPSSAL